MAHHPIPKLLHVTAIFTTAVFWQLCFSPNHTALAFPPPTPFPTQAPAPTITFVNFPRDDCFCWPLFGMCQTNDTCTCTVRDNDIDTCSCKRDAGLLTYGCVTTECCKGWDDVRTRGRRLNEGDRRLMMGADLMADLQDNATHKELYKTYLESCGRYEYATSLYVGRSHLYAVASPTDDHPEAAQAKCPFLVTHAHYENRESEPTKVLLLWDGKEKGETSFADGDWQTKSITIGNFTLSELANAYEAVDLTDLGPFDIISSNCAHYILRLAQVLGVKVDHRMMSFVSRRLVEEKSSDMIAILRRRMEDLTVTPRSFWASLVELVQYYWNELVAWAGWGKSSDEIFASDEALLEQLVDQQVL